MSHLAELPDEHVVSRRSLSKYRRDIEVLRDELICLHSDLRLLSQLQAFPVDLFEAPPALWAFLVRNLLKCSPVRHRRVEAWPITRWSTP